MCKGSADASHSGLAHCMLACRPAAVPEHQRMALPTLPSGVNARLRPCVVLQRRANPRCTLGRRTRAGGPGPAHRALRAVRRPGHTRTARLSMQKGRTAPPGALHGMLSSLHCRTQLRRHQMRDMPPPRQLRGCSDAACQQHAALTLQQVSRWMHPSQPCGECYTHSHLAIAIKFGQSLLTTPGQRPAPQQRQGGTSRLRTPQPRTLCPALRAAATCSAVHALARGHSCRGGASAAAAVSAASSSTPSSSSWTSQAWRACGSSCATTNLT